MERISDETVRKGSITVTPDDSQELVDSIYRYNKHMGECRVKKHQLDEVEKGFVILNPLVTAVITAACAEVVFSRLLNILILAAFAVIFFVFALVKKNYIVITAASLALCIISPIFLILAAADVVMTLMYCRIDGALKNEQGYPAFADIIIRFER